MLRVFEGGVYLTREQIAQDASGEKAFIQIVEQYKGYLMAVILPVVRDREQAQDVLQETFCQVYRSLPHFQGGNLKIWLSRIAVHKAVDFKRHQERLRKEMTAAAAGEQIPAARSAEAEFFNREENYRLAAVLNELPPPYRLTLTGYFLEGKSYRQLAEEAGVTVKTVESRLYRARRILKEQMKEGL
jgi:RNA polymerase sigma factor (sigma-70 family)